MPSFSAHSDDNTDPRIATAVFGVVFGLGLALMVGYTIGGTAGNALGATARFLTVASLFIGLLAPRISIYLLILYCAYLDVLKRSMVLWGQIGFFDLIFVLAPAPALVAGMCASFIISGVIIHKKVPWLHGVLLIICAIFIGAVSFTAMQREGLRSILMQIGNVGVYILMLLAVVSHVRNFEDCRKILVFSLWAFLPVAIYGMWQRYRGLSLFEEEYLRSGYSMIAWRLDAAEIMRPFSTLNSTHALTVMMAVMALLSLYLIFSRKAGGGFFSKSFWGFVFFPIYAWACYATLGRAGWLVLLVGIAALFVFGSPFRTVGFFAAAGVAYIALVLSAGWMLPQLRGWQESLPGDSAVQAAAFRLVTFSDRLEGFQSMVTDSRVYSFFGVPPENRGPHTRMHDAVGNVLVNYGVVGFLVIFGSVAGAAYLIFTRVWRIQDRDERLLCTFLLAICFAVLAGGAVTGNHLKVFPVNAIFYMCAGMLLLLAFPWRKPVESEEKAAKPFSTEGANPFGSEEPLPDESSWGRPLRPRPLRPPFRPKFTLRPDS